jgi:hypothetical protein
MRASTGRKKMMIGMVSFGGSTTAFFSALVQRGRQRMDVVCAVPARCRP